MIDPLWFSAVFKYSVLQTTLCRFSFTSLMHALSGEMTHLSLSHVPAEILSYVIESIRSKSTLRNLALCSRALYEHVVPHLYKHIEVCNLDTECVRTSDQYHPLQDLACLLLQRPDLAQHVRHWTMRDANGLLSRNMCQRGGTARTVQVDEVLKMAIKASSHSTNEEALWLKHASWIDHGDAILALLLPVLVKLQTLELTLSFYDIDRYIERTIHRAARREKPFDNKPALGSLTNFMASSTSFKYGTSSDYIAASMPLPSIHAVYGHSIGTDPNNEVEISPEARTASSTLKHLELRDCKLNGPDITHLLRIPKALTTFIYDIGSDHLSFCSVNPQDIWNALAPHQHCLENLWFDYNQRYEEEWHQEFDTDNDAPGASLSCFKNLQILRIAAIFLFGGQRNKDATGDELADFLPKTLQTLHVTPCEDNFGGTLRTLEELLFHKKDYLPELKNIVLKGSIHAVKISWTGLQKLVGIAESQLISLSVQRFDLNAEWEEWIEQGWGMDESIWWKEGPNGLNRLPACQIMDLATDEGLHDWLGFTFFEFCGLFGFQHTGLRPMPSVGNSLPVVVSI